jgi:glycosyltransferase involved in cell wall biosynthesis
VNAASSDAALPVLKVLLVAPLPPPEHGGMGVWSRIVRKEFAAATNAQIEFVDTTLRYRKSFDLSFVKRYVAGAAQALRDIGRVRRRLKDARPDVLHLCTSGGPASLKDAVVLRLSRRFEVPAVVHYHMGRLPAVARDRFLEWRFTLRAMRRADAVVTLDARSEAVVKEALPGRRVLTLPNMVEVDAVDDVRRQFAGEPVAPAPSVRLVFVGHVLPEKGVRELIAAAARLRHRGVRLDIVGPATSRFRDELHSIADRLGTADWLQFHGGVEHSAAVGRILAADVFVLPSYTEGAPMSVLEAMACGKPIVSCPVGAVPEMLDIGGSQECGALVPCRDVDALASTLDDVASNPAKRQAWGAQARRRVEQHYAAPVACARLLETWQSLVNGWRNA